MELALVMQSIITILQAHLVVNVIVHVLLAMDQALPTAKHAIQWIVCLVILCAFHVRVRKWRIA